MSPYLAVEAYLVSCGGYATQGKGPFDMYKLLDWLRSRQATILPFKPSHNQSMVNFQSPNKMSNRNSQESFEQMMS